MGAITNPVGRIVILLLVALVLTVQLLVLVREGNVKPPGFNSDNVAQQTILSEWQRGVRGGAQLGEDNWFIKFPLYEAMNQVRVSPEQRAFLTAWVLTILTVLGAISILWLIPNKDTEVSVRHKVGIIALSVAAIISLSSYSLYII